MKARTCLDRGKDVLAHLQQVLRARVRPHAFGFGVQILGAWR